MRVGLITFAVVVVVAAWAFSFAGYSFIDDLGNMAGLLMLPLVAVPFVMAFIGHRMTGAIGNPFRGLVWGQGNWWLLVLVAGFLAAGLTLIIGLGLKLMLWDPSMGDYIQMMQDMMREQGQELPPEAVKFLPLQGWFTMGGALLLGPWIGGAMGCLQTFAILGWFGRRLLAMGRGITVGVLIVVTGLSSAAGGLMLQMQNPDITPTMGVLILALMGIASIVVQLWLFLKTRSAVIPALAYATFSSGLAASQPFLADASPLLAPPNGLVASIVLLLLGVALWLMHDPGGDDLAVAAVAYDGTPLTPAQVARLEAEEQAFAEQEQPMPPLDSPDEPAES